MPHNSAVPHPGIYITEMHGKCPLKGIYKNVHGIIILNGQKLGNQMSVNSHMDKLNYIHGMQFYTQGKDYKLSLLSTIGRVEQKTTNMKDHPEYDTFTPFMEVQTHLQWQKYDARGQEESCRAGENVLILIWVKTTEVHTYGKTLQVVQVRCIHLIV